MPETLWFPIRQACRSFMSFLPSELRSEKRSNKGRGVNAREIAALLVRRSSNAVIVLEIKSVSAYHHARSGI